MVAVVVLGLALSLRAAVSGARSSAARGPTPRPMHRRSPPPTRLHWEVAPTRRARRLARQRRAMTRISCPACPRVRVPRWSSRSTSPGSASSVPSHAVAPRPKCIRSACSISRNVADSPERSAPRSVRHWQGVVVTFPPHGDCRASRRSARGRTPHRSAGLRRRPRRTGRRAGRPGVALTEHAPPHGHRARRARLRARLCRRRCRCRGDSSPSCPCTSVSTGSPDPVLSGPAPTGRRLGAAAAPGPPEGRASAAGRAPPFRTMPRRSRSTTTCRTSSTRSSWVRR